jgi:glycosyltransferase involved in cell wall biosynthesis
MLPILFDGWSISYHPNSPAALHLLTLLAGCPTEIQPLVALPAPPPAWFLDRAGAHVLPAAGTSRARLGWEQRTLPQLADQLAAQLIHLVTPSPPLFGRTMAVLSQAETGRVSRVESSSVFFDRLRDSVSRGGMTRLRALLWPEDLPELNDGLLPSRAGVTIYKLPPVVHPEFLQPGSLNISELDLPDEYVLYHGSNSGTALRRLFEIWSWAAGSVGEYYPLVLLGLDEAERSHVEGLAGEFALAGSIRSLPGLSPAQVAAVYRGSSALLHPGAVSPWGDPLRLALASGLPVVAAESPLADAMVGPAAYLAPAGDPRTLGAALITVLVEEELSGRLAQAARQRAATWKMDHFPGRLLETYQRILSL